MDWETLLRNAEAQWRDFIQILARRAPDDERLQTLATGATEVPSDAEEQAAHGT